LHWYGFTAVEDKLAPKVEETISSLRQASIKVVYILTYKIWVLTGDKLETAISIGYSTRILDKGAKLCIFDNDTFWTIEEKLMLLLNEVTICKPF
jgi:magnesium-transporting ATPase (P-type)